jgi:hypothetical protein
MPPYNYPDELYVGKEGKVPRRLAGTHPPPAENENLRGGLTVRAERWRKS